MKILCLGGGPAGLYFGILMKRRDPSHHITIIERNRPDDTFGFGVVFPESTVGSLQNQDEQVYQDITRHCQTWDPIEVRFHGKTILCHGNGFSAISRKQLLTILQQRAWDLGIHMHFQTEFHDLSLLQQYDLVVAADGINSLIRRSFASQFRPTSERGKAKYIWFGTTKLFTSLTFLFEENEDGIFGVHAYPFDNHTSTFIVETDEQTWHQAGLDRYVEGTLKPGESDLASMAYCQQLFHKHLEGHELLANNSKWLNFSTVSNETWHHQHIALMGDAAHTAHFSVGSGTKMAMEDAIALCQALEQHRTIADALAEYERVRRPEVERIQRAALPSLAWWEEFRRYRHFSPEQFTLHFLTRNPSITVEKLSQRDPALVTTVHDWFLHEMLSKTGDNAPEQQMPLLTPLHLGSVTLPHRLVTTLHIDQLALDHRRMAQAGLVFLELPLNVDVEVSLAQWQHLVAAWRTRNQARIGLHIPLLFSQEVPLTDSLSRIYRKYLDVAEALEADVLELDMPSSPEHAHWMLWETMRSLWNSEKLLTLRLAAPEASAEIRDKEFVAMIERFKIHGCDLIGITLGPIETKRTVLHQRRVSDLIRNEVHLPTMLIGGLKSADEINTLILSARTDLYFMQESGDFDLNGS